MNEFHLILSNPHFECRLKTSSRRYVLSRQGCRMTLDGEFVQLNPILPYFTPEITTNDGADFRSNLLFGSGVHNIKYKTSLSGAIIDDKSYMYNIRLSYNDTIIHEVQLITVHPINMGEIPQTLSFAPQVTQFKLFFSQGLTISFRTTLSQTSSLIYLTLSID
jgi:hypothetical protein